MINVENAWIPACNFEGSNHTGVEQVEDSGLVDHVSEKIITLLPHRYCKAEVLLDFVDMDHGVALRSHG